MSSLFHLVCFQYLSMLWKGWIAVHWIDMSCLFIHQLMDIWVVSTFEQLSIMLLHSFVGLYVNISFWFCFSGISQGIELLGHRIKSIFEKLLNYFLIQFHHTFSLVIEGSGFSTFPMVNVYLFNYSYYSRCDMVSKCTRDLHFPHD